MSQRISLNSEQVTLSDVWEHHEFLRATVVREFNDAKRHLERGTRHQNTQLFGMDIEEVNAYFEGILEEIDTQTSLFLLAATEATVRADFLERVYTRKKDAVSQTFRKVYKTRCNHNKVKVRLEEDILDVWGNQLPSTKPDVSRLKGALKYRNWLAHGRYWVPKMGQRYDPIGIIQIATNFLEKTKHD